MCGLILGFFDLRPWPRSVVASSLTIFSGIFARVFFWFALLNALVFATTFYGLRCDSQLQPVNVTVMLEDIKDDFGLGHPLVRFNDSVFIYKLVMCMVSCRFPERSLTTLLNFHAV